MVRTLIVIPIELGPQVIEGKGAVVLGHKTLQVNEIPRRLLMDANNGEESGLGGYIVVLEAEVLLQAPVTSPKSYASPTVEEAEKYIGWLFNPDELLPTPAEKAV